MRSNLIASLTLFTSLQLVSPPSSAQDAEEVIVIGVVPSGAGIDKRKIPFPVQNRNA